jgi:hypothetical protein
MASYDYEGARHFRGKLATLYPVADAGGTPMFTPEQEHDLMRPGVAQSGIACPCRKCQPDRYNS